MYRLTDKEILRFSVYPKADLMARTHILCKRLDKIVDRIVKGGEHGYHNHSQG